MNSIRIGHGYDVHKLTENRDLILGGVKIPHTLGLLGHSDADVLLHAVSDALLGALALGDIGKHFPDTSDKWKGADSKELLAAVMEMVTLRGWAVVNTDITIALQAPKIGKYTEEMRGIIAGILGITPEGVSIKATTTEKLGFTGRSEGCQVWAVVLLSKD